MNKYIIMKKVDGWGEQYWAIEADFNEGDAFVFDSYADARAKALELSYSFQGIRVLTLEITKVNHFNVEVTEEIL